MKKLLIFLIIASFLLSGCSVAPSECEMDSYSLEIETPEFGVVGGAEVVYKTKALCSEMKDGCEIYYMYDFETGKGEKIATVQDFVLKGRNRVFIGDTVYFYITVGDGLGVKNVLYAVDFSENSMYPVSESKYNMKLIPMINVEDKLYVLQGDNATGKTETFLERIKPNGKSKRVDFKRGENTEERLVFFVCTDGEYVYTYEESADTGYLAKYDSDFNCVFELDITSMIKEYPLGGGVGALYVFGNHFILSDISAQSRLCRYDENGVEVLMYDDKLEYIVNTGESEYEFFYLRRTNDIYKLTPETGELEKITYELDNENSVIRYMRAYNDNLFIAKRPPNTEDYTWEMWYYFPYED